MKSVKKQEKILIANRGEIAIRVARSAKNLGYKTVAVYSEADRFSEHVKYCDEAYCIGEAKPSESYLNVAKIIAVAQKSGARMIHPGYGFLSERPHFVEACEKAKIIMIGPSAECMKTMGDKIQARETIHALGILGVPGSAGALKNSEEVEKVAQTIGYPVLLKAAAGGGGKGMRRVDRPEDIRSAFEGASREALGAFGDGSMYLEKYILEPHHVEIQVFGDGQGGAVHLGERECSIQRRHQKVWEETPSPILNLYPKTREKMFECALKITSHIRYSGAGTLEFIVDGSGNFYFLEMNTRLQVEHPISEWVTGVDLVEWQIKLAAQKLNPEQLKFDLPAIPERSGSSIEVRLYAEDSFKFLPAPGALKEIKFGQGPFIRIDTAFTEAGEVSVHYDPMIAKVSVWGETREQALARMTNLLNETKVEPPKKAQGQRIGSLKTNLEFLRKLTQCQMVIDGDTPTDLIPRNPDLTQEATPELSPEEAAVMSLYQLLSEQLLSSHEQQLTDKTKSESRWKNRALTEGLRS